MISSAFTTNLTKDDIDFSGDRKMYAVGIDDQNSENIFVVSKNRAGADSDELFLEKFTKSDSGYSTSFSHKITYPINKSLAFVDNRASYSDVDKDGNYESLSMIEQNENGPESPVQKVTGLIIYKNVGYEVWITSEDGFSQNQYSKNFGELPDSVSAFFLKFWDGLNKN